MENFLFRPLQLWIVIILAVIGIVGAIYAASMAANEAAARASFGHGSNGAAGDIVHSIAEVPSTIRSVLFAEDEPRGADHSVRLDARPTGWTRYDDGAPRTSKIAPYSQWANRRYRALHPLILEDGRIVFTGQFSPLFQLSACGDMIWRQDQAIFHHSVNIDADGYFWAPSFREPSPVTSLDTFRDDAITRVSPNGEIVLQRSMAELLIDHGRADLIYGNLNDDPLHMNDIEPVYEDGPHWKKGDVFVSMRHSSLAVLYRPSTDKIIWLRQGPWLGQHDIDILDDSRIALFNNNYGNRGTGGRVLGTTDVMIYDFATDTVSQPYLDAMGEAMGDFAVKAGSNGLMDFTPSGHMIAEEDTAGRLLIYGPDKKLAAEFINRADKGTVFRMAWSRYVPQDLGNKALAAISECGDRRSALIDG